MENLSQQSSNGLDKVEKAAFLLYCDILWDRCGPQSINESYEVTDTLVKGLKKSVEEYKRQHARRTHQISP